MEIYNVVNVYGAIVFTGGFIACEDYIKTKNDKSKFRIIKRGV